MDENKIINDETENDDAYANLLSSYNEYKKNSVSMDTYNKVIERNNMLTDALFNGESLKDSSAEEPPRPTLDELREKLYGKSNKKLKHDMEYFAASLELRDRNLEETGIDDYVPAGRKYSPTVDDINTANRVADGIRHCLEVANGNPNVFESEFARIISNTGSKNNNYRR